MFLYFIEIVNIIQLTVNIYLTMYITLGTLLIFSITLHYYVYVIRVYCINVMCKYFFYRSFLKT